MAREVRIEGESIRLGQLLKLAGAIDSGGEARALLAEQPAIVNGEPETRRGRRVRPGDVVRFGALELVVLAAPPDAAGAA